MPAGGSIPLVPRLARGLLRWMLPAHLRQAVIGDFQELYASLAERRGRTHANLWYWRQTFQSVLACAGGDLAASAGELWRSVVAALRTLLRERRATVVNVAGLTLAFTVAILVAFHIGRETGFDRYHLQADRIFRVVTDLTLGGKPNSIASTNAALGPAMVETMPSGQVDFRPNRPRSPQVTRTMIAGSVRGNCRCPQSAFVQTRIYPASKLSVALPQSSPKVAE